MNFIKALGRQILEKIYPELKGLSKLEKCFSSYKYDVEIGEYVKLFEPYKIYETSINEYTYIQTNSQISKTHIGKFCSIGPNFLCGFGIHPTNGLSTSPVFYSTEIRVGLILSKTDKIIERKKIVIGNDVFIGANVTILDGIQVGDGAIIGAGTIVSKNVPPYAIVIGNPMKILRYRFSEDNIKALQEIKWWDFKKNDLKDVEKHFYQIEDFIKKYSA